jgi:sec-independent protein translocase protein TatA
MFGSLGTPELLVIFFVVLLLFGAKKLPEMARGMGKAISEFKRGTSEIVNEFQNADRDLPDEARRTATTGQGSPRSGS